MQKICDYGCKQIAIKLFKNGKHCCSNKTSGCPAMKKKNKEQVTKARNRLGPNYWKNGHPRPHLGKPSPLKGRTYDDIYGKEKADAISQKMSDKAKSNIHSWNKMSEITKETIRQNARKRIIDRYEQGWMPKAGRCAKYTYVSEIAGSVSLDGTWELAVAQWLDEQNYVWRRNIKRFPYINLQEKLSHYTPDFFVESIGYIEVKGYETALDRCKWSQFPEKLTVWKKKQLTEMKLI